MSEDESRQKAHDALAFAQSCIRSGEPMTEQAQRVIREGFDAIASVSEDAERFRLGLEDALNVSFTVGLLRLRALQEGDNELAEWGERLKAQLVAIREVLSPGTAEAFSALREP